MILIQIFLVIFFCACYAIGGQGPKWVRRFLGTGVFGVGLWLLAINRSHFGLWAIFAGAWAMPSLLIFKYGVNDGSLWKKIALRAVYGASLGLCGLFAGLAGHHPTLGILQLVAGAVGSTAFGVLNPFAKLGDRGVMLEDVCISASAVALVPFII